MMFRRITEALPPVKGTWPVTAWNNTDPRLKRSDRPSSGWLRACCGLM
jgi:hypothetical protein